MYQNEALPMPKYASRDEYYFSLKLCIESRLWMGIAVPRQFDRKVNISYTLIVSRHTVTVTRHVIITFFIAVGICHQQRSSLEPAVEQRRLISPRRVWMISVYWNWRYMKNIESTMLIIAQMRYMTASSQLEQLITETSS